MKLLYLNLVNF